MTFVERVISNLRKAGEAPFIREVEGTQFKDYSGSRILSYAAQVQFLFDRYELKPGNRVALLSPNSAKWVACDLASLATGTVSVPLYSRQSPQELAGILKDCQPSLLIVSDSQLEKDLLSAWNPTCPILNLSKVLTDNKTEASLEIKSLSSNSLLTIVYTSGTSGEPKGVMLSLENLEFMLERTTETLEEAKGDRNVTDRVFHFLPCCFLGSHLMMWTQLYRGNPFMFSTDLKNLAQEISIASPNYFLTVPAVLERIRNGVTEKLSERGGFVWNVYQKRNWLAKLLVYPKIRKKIGKNLKFIISGSAPLSAECQSWFMNLGIPILQVYGLTETTGIVTMDRPGKVKAGFTGKAIRGCEMKLTEEGELITRGPNNFLGYWNRPKATEEVLRSGWIHTGDQCEIDSEGRLKVLGRMKNVLVSLSGHNVAPEPIEQKLVEQLKGAEHAFVVGHGRPFLSVLITGQVPQEELERALNQLNAEAPHYKKIRKFQRLDEHFTIENGLLTANQKVKRKAIEQRFKPVIDHLYEAGQ